jgi:uncharacterized membrane protein YccC
MSDYVSEKTKTQILQELNGTAQPHSSVHEQQKMGIIVRCTEDMEKSLENLRQSMNQTAGQVERALGSLEASTNQNAESSQNLAKKIFWLNAILTTATVVGTLLAVLSFTTKW